MACAHYPLESTQTCNNKINIAVASQVTESETDDNNNNNNNNNA
jgi:hypothetical protein